MSIGIRLLVACCVLALVDCTPPRADQQPLDGEQIFRRYVEAWLADETDLLETVGGPDAPRLIETLNVFKREGVVSAVLDGVREDPERPSLLEGVVHLRFADGSQLDVTPQVEVEGGSVLARPGAITDQLTRWESLRIERFGSPATGEIRSRDGSLLAEGPLGRRVPASRSLAPAVSLIDDSLTARLSGRIGRRLVVTAPRRVLAESAVVDGEDVTTSLDDGLQAAAEKVLGKRPGALIAVEPSSGGIRALVSNPRPGVPNVSPASSASSPGSTFKLITAAAALESAQFEIDDIVPCPARLFVFDRMITTFREIGYGDITLRKAFSLSCNTAFARVGLTIGSDRLLRMAQSLGIGVTTTVEPGAIAIPRSESELAVYSFGAAGSLLTPLQMAGIGTAIARGGSFVEPRWTDEAVEGTRVFSRATADDLVTMMEDVVRSGTGTNAEVPGMTIAGKTGTAEIAPESPVNDGWFVGIAPSREPRVLVVVFLPHGGLGGAEAATLAGDFLEATIALWE